MPVKPSGTQQFQTLAQAQATLARITSVGIPVANLKEQFYQNGNIYTIPVDDPEYQDDGMPHMYTAEVWGSVQEVGLLGAKFGNGGLTGALQVAEISFYDLSPAASQAKAYAAILSIDAVKQAVDAALTVKV